jgi:hypothetical protein
MSNGILMPQKRRKEADCNLPQPEITSLGKWPLAQKNIRQWARDRGLPSEEIEQFLDDIEKARGRGLKNSHTAGLCRLGAHPSRQTSKQISQLSEETR